MTIHVVGAGLAGLSAAIHAQNLGAKVQLYEASPNAGGRIRRVGDHDNGTHLLVKGYSHTFEYLEMIGGKDRLKPYPSKAYSMGEGPLYWDVPGKHIFGHIARGVVPGVHILNLMGKTAKRRLWEPLYMAVFNTPMKDVPRKLVTGTFLEILKYGPEAMEPYFAEDTLDDALVRPALEKLTVKCSKRLTKITETELVFRDETIALGENDKVVLALPAQAYPKIEHPFNIPEQKYSAITNIHFYPDLSQRERFFGLVNTLSQWVYTKDNYICVTISNHDETGDELADHIWKEIRFHLDMAEAPTPKHRIVCEKFATPLQDKRFLDSRPGYQSSLPNVFLAGDWIDTGLPCTIEGAIKSGKTAAEAIFS